VTSERATQEAGRGSELAVPAQSWISISRTATIQLCLAAILLLAFALRVAVYLQDSKPFSFSGLVAVQAEMARNIVDHGKWFVVNQKAASFLNNQENARHHLIDPEEFDFSRFDRHGSFEPQVHQMPGVSVILAGFWWATGHHSYAAIQWLQLLLDAGMVLLIYWIARKLRAAPWAALLASLLYAVWPGAILVAKRPTLDTWAGFFVIVSVAIFLYARERVTKLWPLVVLGLVTGFGIYFRPFILFLPILLALVATPSGGWRRRFTWMAVPTIVALVILTPWTVRNYYEFHAFIPTRTGLGEAALEGLGKVKNDTGVRNYVQRNKPGLNAHSPQADSFLLKTLWHAIVADPVRYFETVGRRARVLLPSLLAILLWRRRRTEALILVATAVAVILPFLPIGGDVRFFLPAAFAYFILGAIALETLVLRRRRAPSVAGSEAPGAAVP